MFQNCNKLESITGINNWDTTYIFENCSSLKSLDLSNWDIKTSGGAIQGAFSGCTALENLVVFKLNATVTTLWGMFQNCSSLKSLDLTRWTVLNKNIRNLCLNCTSLESINMSNWNTSGFTATTSAFTGVPVTVNWNYDGTNYANWTLTESASGYSGTFPWNQSNTTEE